MRFCEQTLRDPTLHSINFEFNKPLPRALIIEVIAPNVRAKHSYSPVLPHFHSSQFGFPFSLSAILSSLGLLRLTCITIGKSDYVLC